MFADPFVYPNRHCRGSRFCLSPRILGGGFRSAVASLIGAIQIKFATAVLSRSFIRRRSHRHLCYLPKGHQADGCS